MKFLMEQGVTYLIKEPKPDDSLKVFATLVKNGQRGFCITRVHPKRIRKRFELGDTPILWITTSEVPDEKCVHPSDLAKLNMAINEMLKSQENLVILLEGIEYLVTYNGFDSILRFVQFINDRIMVTNSRFMITLDPATLDTGSLHILERDLVAVENLGKLDVTFTETPETPASEATWRNAFEERLGKWKEQGLAVDSLEAALAAGRDEAARAFEQYETSVARIAALGDELRSMEISGFEKEAAALRLKMLNPLLLKEAEDDILALQVAMERRKKGETRRKFDEDKLRDELRAKLRGWNSAGYNTSSLGAVLNEPLETARKEFERFEAAIQKLRDLNDELILMDTAGFESEVEGIRSRLSQPSRVNEVEDDIFRLKILIERRRKEERRKREDDERARADLTARIDRWRSEGYDISRLGRASGLPPTELRAELDAFEKDVAALKEFETELLTINPRGVEAELDRLRAKLKNPAMLGELRADIASLKKRTEKSQEEMRKDDIQRKIMEWKVLGFNIDRFKALENSEPDIVQKELVVFKIRVHRLKELESELALLDTTGFESLVSALQPLFRDVDKIPEVESRLTELRIKVKARAEEMKKGKDERARLKRELVDRMAVWLSQGHSVARLEELLGKEGDLDRIVREFDRFERDIVRSREIAGRLRSLDVTGFERDAEDISRMLSDPSRAAEAEQALSALEANMRSSRDEETRLSAEDEKRKKKALERIAAWKAQGINVSSIEKALAEGWDEFKRELAPFSLKSEKMRGIKEELDLLETRGFEQAAAALRDRLTDIDSADAVELEFKALRAKIDERKEKERKDKDAEKGERNVYLQKVLAWSSQGMAVEKLEKMIDQPMEVLRPEFERFDRSISRLEQIRRDLLTMDVRGFEDRAAGLAARLNRPEEIDSVEKDLAALRAGLEKRQDDAGARQDRREQIKKRVESLRSIPINVSRMDGILEGDIDALDTAFEGLMSDVKRLRGARKRLAGLQTRGFEDELGALEPMLQDPDRAGELEAGVDALAARVEEKRQAEGARRGELMARIDAWAEKGVNVGPLLEASEGDIESFRKAVDEFSARLDEMQALEERLRHMKRSILHPEAGEGVAERVEETEAQKEDESRLGAEESLQIEKAEHEVEEEVGEIRKLGVAPADRAAMERTLREQHRAQIERMARKDSSRKRKRVIAAGLAMAIIVSALVGAYAWYSMSQKDFGGLVIDGNFSDWEGIKKERYPSDPGLPPDIDILETAAVGRDGAVFVYVKTAGTILKGARNVTTGNYQGDNLRMMFDSDRMLGTGCQTAGIGADFAVEIYGWNNIAQEMRYLRYTGDPQSPWAIIRSGTTMKSQGSELEFKVLPEAFGLTGLGTDLVKYELRDSFGNVATAG
jgi:hypothetical protein